MSYTPENRGNLLKIGRVSWKLSDYVQSFVVDVTDISSIAW